MKKIYLALACFLAAACIDGPANRGALRVRALGCPTAHAGPFEACYAQLDATFPGTPRNAWAIEACGDLGVLATDERDGETYAVNPAGDVYHVDPGCGWTLLAD